METIKKKQIIGRLMDRWADADEGATTISRELLADAIEALRHSVGQAALAGQSGDVQGVLSDAQIDTLLANVGPTAGIYSDSRDLSLDKIRTLVRSAILATSLQPPAAASDGAMNACITYLIHGNADFDGLSDALVEYFKDRVSAVKAAAPQPAQAELSDEQIKSITTDAVSAGKLSWLGYEKDEDGKHTIPSMSPFHYQFARVIAASLQPAAAPAQANCDSSTQAMADCMDMVRQELIEAGIVGKDVAPMFVADAVMVHIKALRALVQAAPVQAAVVPDGIRQRTDEIRIDFENHRMLSRKKLVWMIECLLGHIALTNAAPSPAPVQPVPVGDEAKRMQDNEADIEIALAAMTSAGINSVFPTNMRHRINVALDAVDTARRLRTQPADAAPVEAVPVATRIASTSPFWALVKEWANSAAGTPAMEAGNRLVEWVEKAYGSPAQATPAKAVDERAAFEKWAQLTSHQLNGVHHDVAGWYYFDSDTENCWQAWQARALAQASDAYQQGRAVGIEEAAKAIEPKDVEYWGYTPADHVRKQHAAAIRALAAPTEHLCRNKEPK